MGPPPPHPHPPLLSRHLLPAGTHRRPRLSGYGGGRGGEGKWIGRIPNVAPSTYRKLLELRQDFGSSFQILLKPFKILDRRVSPLSIMLCTRWGGCGYGWRGGRGYCTYIGVNTYANILFPCGVHSARDARACKCVYVSGAFLLAYIHIYVHAIYKRAWRARTGCEREGGRKITRVGCHVGA